MFKYIARYQAKTFIQHISSVLNYHFLSNLKLILPPIAFYNGLLSGSDSYIPYHPDSSQKPIQSLPDTVVPSLKLVMMDLASAATFKSHENFCLS